MITFDEPSTQIYNRFRAFDPWPGMFFESAGTTIKAPELSIAHNVRGVAPRTVLSIDSGVTVATGEGAIVFQSLQRSGKPRASAGNLARTLGWKVGERIP